MPRDCEWVPPEPRRYTDTLQWLETERARVAKAMENWSPERREMHERLVGSIHADYRRIAERDGITLEQARIRFWYGQDFTGRDYDPDIDRGPCRTVNGIQREGY